MSISAALHFPRMFLIAEVWNRLPGGPHSFSSLVSNIQTMDPQAQRFCDCDCKEYVRIATQSVKPLANTCAFFPLWSSVIRFCYSNLSAFFQFLPPTSLAVYLSNLFSWLGIAVLCLLGKKLQLKTPAAGTFFLPLSVAIFPYSLSYSIGYTESIFVFLYSLVLLLLSGHQWVYASALVGILGISRPQGAWIAVIFAFFFLSQLLQWGRKIVCIEEVIRPPVILLSACIAVFPLILYLIWQWIHYDNPFMLIQAQYSWGRHFSPWRAVLDQLPRIKPFQIMIWLSVLGSISWMRRPQVFWKFLGICTLVVTELPLFSGGFLSYPRFLSSNLGLFIYVSELLSRPSKFLAYRAYVEIALVIWAVLFFVFELNEYFYIPGYCL
jgi:hypothetical protein